MKGRSSRLPTSAAAAAPEDWVDGSWTVDCSCGVTFDDGEEMVSCDECGVWVHTRCSRFSKSDASFACHNCRRIASDDDAEETEVAQLLAELPTKSAPPPMPMPPTLVRRLGLEIPLEDRVHVHGVPGGDPDLFRGQVPSSVFTSALWKCTGYVPKQFKFRYMEFPCWGEEEGDEGVGEEEENTASLGADVLFSLSKVPVLPETTTVWDLMRPRPMEATQRPEGGANLLFGGRSLGSSTKKEDSNRVQVNSKKRKEEDRGRDRDQSLKKKKKKGGSGGRFSNDAKKGSVPLVDMNKSDLCRDGALQVADSKTMHGSSSQVGKKGSSLEPMPCYQFEPKKPRNILVVKTSKAGSSHEVPRKKESLEASAKLEKVEQLELERIDESAANNDASTSSIDEGRAPHKLEGMLHTRHVFKRMKQESRYEECTNGAASVFLNSESSKRDESQFRKSHGRAFTSNNIFSNGETLLFSKHNKTDVKAEGDDQTTKSVAFCPSIGEKFHDVQLPGQNFHGYLGLSPESSKFHDVCKILPSNELKVLDPNEGIGRHEDAAVSGPNVLNQNDLAVQESIGTVVAHDLQAMQDLKCADELSKEGHDTCYLASSDRNQVVAPGEVTILPAVNAIYCSVSDRHGSPCAISPTSLNPVHCFSTQVNSNPGTAGKNSEIGSLTEESMSELSRNKTKDCMRDSTCSEPKSSQTSKSLYGSASKHRMPGLKERTTSSSKSSAMERTTSNEGYGSCRTQNVPAKLKSSTPFQKNEKFNRSFAQPPSKAFGNAAGVHRPDATVLSDEELALLLHQELNSSPRVPRVPRIRQAAGMQLTSPTGTSMLSKQSYFSKGLERIPVSRRKNKEDALRDGSRNSRELSDETSRMGRSSSSHQNPRGFESGRSPDVVTSGKKNVTIGLPEDLNCCSPTSLELNGAEAFPRHSSTRDVATDDGGINSRTLPGLIDEIMKKSNCMTYEELCEAVRPHWRTLRKPNGERYAYAGHSQAVLDCLRNRNEWSRLIDRGSKTNSYKRRAAESNNTQVLESENEEARRLPRDIEEKNADMHPDGFPKGMRKARKRRRLELRGRATRDSEIHHDREATALDDDDDEEEAMSLTNSGNEGANGSPNEEESDEARRCAEEGEASKSSSEGSD